MSGRIRFAEPLYCLLLILTPAAPVLALEEALEVVTRPSHSAELIAPLTGEFGSGLTRLSQTIRGTRIDLPRQPRVSRSHRFLYQFTLISGDRFLGELLARDEHATKVRLQTRQIVEVPSSAITQIANPPGEADLLYDGFEHDSSAPTETGERRILDPHRAADGTSSLRLDPSATGYSIPLDPPILSGRVEFSFFAQVHDPSQSAGEWRLVWNRDAPDAESMIVRVGADHSVSIAGIAISPAPPRLKIGPGWHTFLMRAQGGRVEFLIDDSTLATVRGPATPLASIDFRPANPDSGNGLWIDELHVRRYVETSQPLAGSIDAGLRDKLVTITGDELFGQITHLSPPSVQLIALGQSRSIPLSRLVSLNWHQPDRAVNQRTIPATGVSALIQLQPFVDRPDCLPERLTATICDIDARQLRVRHQLMGDMTFRWSEVLRVTPRFFGQSVLVDARRFHLGNSIRSDFHRQLPDGTEVSGEVVLNDVPAGEAFFTIDVAELEASGPKAPPGSPFLPELRRGQLITEVLINGHSIGDLNSQVRFKASAANPDRVRLPIPDSLLKPGRNTFQLKQHSLEKRTTEFDDCEVGNIQLEFESTFLAPTAR
ncbi:hypothetical protein [Schlesneria sp. T3-172]|uniref:hypothetical protein n=1 Tax=Schlesneria sphaerica TaxID=3373610 RepID=UPI0037CBE22D